MSSTSHKLDEQTEMELPIEVTDSDLLAAPIPHSLKQEITLLRLLMPLVGHCLTLNHDINNPLAGILGYGEFLQMDEQSLTKEQVGHLRQIMTCAERIRREVNLLCDKKMDLASRTNVAALTSYFQAKAAKLD